MGIALIIVGAFVIYCSWRLLFRISDEKVHRNFSSWWTERMPKEDAEGFQVAYGALLSVFILFAGIVLIMVGIAKLLGWTGGAG